MSTASTSTLSLIIEARNRASSALHSVTSSMGRMTGGAQALQGSLQLVQSSILSLTLLAPLLASVFAGMATSDAAQKIINYERGLRRARIQLQLMGFTAEDASDRLERLNKIMGEPTHRALVANAEALRNVTLAGDNLVEQIAPMSISFARLLDLDVVDTMDAIVTAITTLDPTKFIQLVGAVEGLDLDRDSGIFKALEIGDVQPFMEMISDFINVERLSGREKLARNSEKLLELILPTQAAVSEGAAALANIVVLSIIDAMENSEAGKQASIAAFMATWQWFSVKPRGLLATVGRFPNLFWMSVITALSEEARRNPIYASRMSENLLAIFKTAGRSLAAGAVGFVLPTLLENIPEVLTDPELLVIAGVASAVLGRYIGRNISTALAATALVAFGPAISGFLDDLSTDEKIKLLATAFGVVMARFMRLGIMQSLSIGTLIYQSLTDLHEDDPLKMQMGLLGALIGLTVGGRFGRIFSALLGFEIGRGVREQFRGKTMEEIKKETAIMGANLGKELLVIGELILTAFNFWVTGALVFTAGMIESLMKDIGTNVIRELKLIGDLIADIWDEIRSNPLKAVTTGIDDAIGQYKAESGVDQWEWEASSNVNKNFGWGMPIHRALDLANSGTFLQQQFASSYLDALKLGGQMRINDERILDRREKPDNNVSPLDAIIEELKAESDALASQREMEYQTTMQQFDFGDPYGPETPFELGPIEGPVRPPSGPAVPSYTQDPVSLMEGATSPYNTLVIQLKIDKKVIKEIAVEGVYEVAKHKAGMFKGSIE